MSSVPAARDTDDRILSVLELTGLIKGTLEGTFPAVWVRGEVSGCKRADSGHVYFTLKDGRDAVLSCAMWRTAAQRLRFEPRDGLQVEAFGAIEVYPQRGNYQLIVRELRPAGIGARLLALEELKKKLQAEGLFDPARKRPLPRYPRRIGIVTSPVGAAVRDLVKVARARWPSIGLVLAPVRVQGEGAAVEIASAIRRFNRYGEVDLLIVGRGGGSIEELWPFNEEIVVRAIAASAIPVVSAVGHEVDWTLADLAADVRAATPSNAAELAVPSRAEEQRRVEALSARMKRAMQQGLLGQRRRLAALTQTYGFQRHRDLLDRMRQRIDDVIERGRQALRSRVRGARAGLAALTAGYGLREFLRAIRERRQRLAAISERIEDRLTQQIPERRRQVENLQHRLRALSPRLVLERGYCLVRRADGRLLRDSAELGVGDLVTMEFARGEADARVEAVRTGGNDGPRE